MNDRVPVPSLSVVVPAHDSASFIRMTLESLAALEPPPGEVLVVDDGSTDATPIIVNELLLELHLNGRLLSQTQQGVSAARNRGLNEATGQYVLFLDSDDLVAPKLTERLRAAISDFRDPASDVVCWRFQHSKEDGSRLPTFDRSFSNEIPRISTGPETLTRVLRDEAQAISTISAAYRRGFLEDHGLLFTEGCETGEDTEFIWKALATAHAVGWVDEVLSYYVDRPGSVTSVANVSRFDTVVALQRTTEFLRGRPDELSRSLAPVVSERILPRFFGVLPLFTKDGWGGSDLLHALEVRHPGLIHQVRWLIWHQIVRRRRLSLARLLFVASPRLCLAYLRGRYSAAFRRLPDQDLEPPRGSGLETGSRDGV